MKAGQQTNQDIIRELLPTMPPTFTRQDLMDRWPPEQQANKNAVCCSVNRLRLLGVVERVGRRKALPLYRYLPEPEPERPPMEAKWRAFRNNPQGYLESL